MTDADQDELLRLCVEAGAAAVRNGETRCSAECDLDHLDPDAIVARVKSNFAKRKGAENDDPSDSRRDDRDGIRGDRSPDGDGAVVLRVSEGERAVCPQCRGPLQRVTQGRVSWMNAEQFDTVRAGDWFCEACPDNGRGKSGLSYWWNRELSAPAAPAQGEQGRGEISDGYHTFNELYDHRITLWVALCRALGGAWRSRLHSDGSKLDGWFVLGHGRAVGEQITYHLPDSRWEETEFAETLERGPEFDGHTTDDVLYRLRKLSMGVDASTPQQASGDATEQPDGRCACGAAIGNHPKDHPDECCDCFDLGAGMPAARVLRRRDAASRAAGLREGRRLGLVRAERIAAQHTAHGGWKIARQIKSQIRAAIAELAAEPEPVEVK